MSVLEVLVLHVPRAPFDKQKAIQSRRIHMRVDSHRH